MSIRDEARDEYVRRSIGPSVGIIGDRLALAWEAGAEWAASCEPTDDLRAEAWEQGNRVGWSDCKLDTVAAPMTITTNPYRQENRHED